MQGFASSSSPPVFRLPSVFAFFLSISSRLPTLSHDLPVGLLTRSSTSYLHNYYIDHLTVFPLTLPPAWQPVQSSENVPSVYIYYMLDLRIEFVFPFFSISL